MMHTMKLGDNAAKIASENLSVDHNCGKWRMENAQSEFGYSVIPIETVPYTEKIIIAEV